MPSLRPVFVVLVLPMLLLGSACGGSPPPSGKGAVIVSGARGDSMVGGEGQRPAELHVENKADFDRFAFSCCANPSGTAVVGAYVDMAEKLAADDTAGAAAASGQLAAHAKEAAGAASLDEEARGQAATIATVATGLGEKDLAGMRQAFPALGLQVIAFARGQQGGATELVASFCPMAPGHWLQRNGVIRNPFYGSDMLTCGTLESLDEAK